MKLIKNWALIFVVLLTTACARTTLIRHSKDYETFAARPKKVLILPPIVEVNSVDFSNRKERKYDYESHLERIITEVIMSPMQEKGFRIKLLRRKDIAEQKLGKYVMDLREAYNKGREELYAPLLWEESKAFTVSKNVGQSAKLLGEVTQADLLLMIDYAGVVKTNGARTRDFLLGVLTNNSRTAFDNADNSIMVIGLIDTRSGNIIWTNMGSTSKDVIASAAENFASAHKVDTEKMQTLITNILTPLK